MSSAQNLTITTAYGFTITVSDYSSSMRKNPQIIKIRKDGSISFKRGVVTFEVGGGYFVDVKFEFGTEIEEIAGNIVPIFAGSYKRMFDGCSIEKWNYPTTLNPTDTSYMFARSKFGEGVDLSGWNVSAVTNMRSMFLDAADFNADLSNWDVSAVTDMSEMFSGATSFNSDLSRWDVSAVTDMSCMFYDATSFNGDLSRWNGSAVTNMSCMFWRATSFNLLFPNFKFTVFPKAPARLRFRYSLK